MVVGSLSGGSHSVTWDRTDNNGQRVPNGTYTVQLRASDSVGDTAAAALAVTAK